MGESSPASRKNEREETAGNGKLIRGQVINDKKTDTVIKAIESKWIVGGGVGPGHPKTCFFSDNGGEFLNEDLIDFAAALDISIRITAAASPWMNGNS